MWVKLVLDLGDRVKVCENVPPRLKSVAGKCGVVVRKNQYELGVLFDDGTRETFFRAYGEQPLVHETIQAPVMPEDVKVIWV